ncbi:MAG TPA: ribonuclease H [Cyclobacteriaceae bacterium]
MLTSGDDRLNWQHATTIGFVYYGLRQAGIFVMDTCKIMIYTDGSCNPGLGIGAWAAILIIQHEKVVRSGHAFNTTHQRMEVTAIIESVGYVAGRPSRNGICVVTDSQYIVNIAARKEEIKARGYKTGKGSAMRNHDLVRAFISLIDDHTISFVKVKAHQRDVRADPHNREADKLARKVLRQYVKKALR